MEHRTGIMDKLLTVFTPTYNRAYMLPRFLAGDGELRKEIENKIEELHIKDNIRMLGVRNDVPNLLQAADCFLFPSNYEGLAVTVIEAQAAGLHCFVSDTQTKDMDITPLLSYLPIDKGAEVWADAIDKADMKRKDVSSDIVKAGFDVRCSSEWVANFYREVCLEGNYGQV